MLTGILLARMAIVAALPLLILPTLPSGSMLIVMAMSALLALRAPYAWLRLAGTGGLLLVWALSAATSSLKDIETFSRAPATFQVRIDELRPERQQIRVQLISHAGRYLFPPRFAWLSTAQQTPAFCPGQRWVMSLKLRPVHARLNEGDFDAQRHAIASHTALQGRTGQQQSTSLSCSWRWRYLQRHLPFIQTLNQSAILEALAFGERAGMSAETRQLLRQTGTAHLMAISGMHIGLAAGTGWLLARAVQRLLPAKFIGYLFPLLASGLVAALYSWLSGSQAPAQRALLALSLWMVIRVKGINLSGWQVWTLCVGLLLMLDPLSVLSDSFWLSVLAVAMLLVWYQWFPLAVRFRQGWRWLPLQLLHLQAGMMLLMAPLQVALFDGISLTAMLANLIAVPVISLISVPLILMAMLLPAGSVSAFFWWLADQSLIWLVTALQTLPSGWWTFYDAGAAAIIIWGGLIIWRCALFYAAPVRCIALLLTVIACRWPREEPGWGIDMLDVGHGLSIVLRQGKEAVLYDTGPRWRNDNAGARIILPWLARKQLRIHSVILSHRHLDHSGGLDAILAQDGKIAVRSATRDDGHLPCIRGTRWRWGQLNFEVLWPLRLSDSSNNNDSCVVRVDDGQTRLLLTGDLEAPAERKLVALEQQKLKAEIIQVPHHGSRTSSTPLLLRNTAGQTAIASVSRYNAWRMPAKTVMKNYRRYGYSWYDTAQQGQISIRINRGEIAVSGLREHLLPRWYHQWFGVKRESG